MSKETLYTTEICEIFYDSADDYICIKWDGFVPANDITPAYLKAAEVVKEKNCNKLMVEHRLIKGVTLGNKAEESVDWLTKMRDNGLEYFVFLQEDNMVTKLYLEKTLRGVVESKPFKEIIYSTDHTEAMNWLKSK